MLYYASYTMLYLHILTYTYLAVPLATLCDLWSEHIRAPGCVGAGKGAGHKPICAVYAPSSGSGGKAGRVGFCKCGGSKAKLARARCSLLLRGPRAVRVSRERNKLPQTDDSWAMGCGNCNLGFTLYLWMILDGLSISNPFKTFQDYVAATRNLNILRCPASDLAHAVLCCSFQGIGCRVCHRLYMWLCHRRCFIDLIPQEGCHVFCTSPWGCPSAKAAGSQDLITRYKNGMKQTYWSSLKPVETDSSWLDLSQVEIL